jgi:putative FmdB family regulatory protein
MPTYDYECQACGHAFELFQSMTAAVKRTCPSCGKPRLKRLIGTGAGVIFKGGGFYETDYRSESYKKAAAGESKTSEGSSAGGGTDAKGSGSGSGGTAGDAAASKPAKDASPPKAGKSGKGGSGS